MSSNPRAEKVRRLLRGWPLRTRLIAAMVALLAVVCLVISVVTVVALRHALMERLDSQLVNAGSRVRQFVAAQAMSCARLWPPSAGTPS